MGGSVLADAGFIVALLSRDDAHHAWAMANAPLYPRPWLTCESVLSEAFHVVGSSGMPALSELLRRRSLRVAVDLEDHVDRVLRLMQKYADVPMSLADACLVRMTETLDDPLLLTTDSDFRIFRRHGRNIVPCVVPD